MSRLSIWSAVLYLTLFTSGAHAADIVLQNVDRDDYSKLVGDFSANSHHTSVSGASTLGEIFGFELGVVAGVTKTPNINSLAKEVDPGSDVAQLPHGELLGVLSVPFGITVEAGFIPKVGNEDFKFSAFALAGKWTFSDMLELPVSLAVKAQVAKSALNFTAKPSGVPTSFSYDNTTTTLYLMVSKNLGILEPYFAIGTAKAEGKMVVSGSGTVFSDPEFAASQSASATKNSPVILLGTEVKLAIVKLGAEFSRMYDTNSFTGKVSFFF